MVTFTVMYGDHLPTGDLLQKSIKSDIYDLKYLIDNLNSNDYVLLGYNDAGVIIGQKEIISLEGIVHNLISRISYLEGRVYYFETILENNSISVTNKSKIEDCAAEFFLLYDLLPEHIKKEIKIYIKKNNKNMSLKLKKKDYENLVRKNVEWLKKQPKCFERDHIINTVKESVKCYYDKASQVQDEILLLNNKERNALSDGYHTYEELYEFRKMYNAALFNEWAGDYNYAKGINEVEYDVHKSWRHNDGELCFGGGWFVVMAMLPAGQITNHYKAEDWDLFRIPEEPTAKYAYDWHTSQDVLDRLRSL